MFRSVVSSRRVAVWPSSYWHTTSVALARTTNKIMPVKRIPQMRHVCMYYFKLLPYKIHNNCVANCVIFKQRFLLILLIQSITVLYRWRKSPLEFDKLNINIFIIYRIIDFINWCKFKERDVFEESDLFIPRPHLFHKIFKPMWNSVVIAFNVLITNI